MVRVLTHICQDKKLDNMTFLKAEICELFEISPEELDAARDNGLLRCYDSDGIIYYEMNEVIKYRVATMMDVIYNDLENLSLNSDHIQLKKRRPRVPVKPKEEVV